MAIVRKGGKQVTIPLAPRTGRTLDLYIGERESGPIFLGVNGKRMDRYAADRTVTRLSKRVSVMFKNQPATQTLEPPCATTAHDNHPTATPPTSSQRNGRFDCASLSHRHWNEGLHVERQRRCSTWRFTVGCLRVSKLSMDGQRIVRLLCAMAIACLVAIVPSPGIANAATFEQCSPSAFIAPDGDLRVELGRRRIAFAGTVASIDAATLRRELAEVLDANGTLKGSEVCLLLRTQNRKANYVTKSIPDVVGAIKQISGSAVFRCPRSPGRTNHVGWMKRDDKVIIQRLGSGLFPVDVGIVGLFEDQPISLLARAPCNFVARTPQRLPQPPRCRANHA